MAKEKVGFTEEEPVVLTPPKGWRTQRRRLDTCACVYQEAWNPNGKDTDEPIPYLIENLCGAHRRFYNRPAEHHAFVLAENKLKNKAIKEVLDALPDEYKTIKKDKDTGEETVHFKNGDPTWSFEDGRESDIRRLEITIPNITEALKKKISAVCKAKFPGNSIYLK